MKSFIPVFLLTLLSVSFIFSSCSQEDTFAANPMGSLSFSADTLSFDTVFSTLGTPTAWLKIYNTGDRKIKISGISLKSGGNSGFRINVDGESNVSFTDVEIPAKDSLFLFVALTAPEKGDDKPFKISDIIQFQSDDGQKQIVLEAYSQDVKIWRGKILSSDTTLTADKPFLIYDSLVVAKGVTLTIPEGVTFHFHDKAKLEVYGTLKAAGSALAPVTFRGDRLDDVLPDLPYDYYPGQWGYIRLAESSYGNEFDHVCIRGAKYGVVADSSSLEKSKLIMTNSVIHNMVNNCLLSSHCKISVANSQITNSGLNTVQLFSGEYDFTHCTIANYQRLISVEGSALAIANDPALTLRVRFYNCIVYGNHSSEIDTSLTSPATWSLLFKNCLLRSKEWSAEIASGCVYPKDFKFKKLGLETDKYQFDFRLDSLSEAIDQADAFYSKDYPIDLDGKSRLNDKGPDIGAYEWTPGVISQ